MMFPRLWRSLVLRAAVGSHHSKSLPVITGQFSAPVAWLREVEKERKGACSHPLQATLSALGREERGQCPEMISLSSLSGPPLLFGNLIKTLARTAYTCGFEPRLPGV